MACFVSCEVGNSHLPYFSPLFTVDEGKNTRMGETGPGPHLGDNTVTIVKLR